MLDIMMGSFTFKVLLAVLPKRYNPEMQNRIRLLRAERKWLQAKLAESSGASGRTVNALESRKYDPSLPPAFKIAQLFNTPIELIFSAAEETVFIPEQPSALPKLSVGIPFTSRAKLAIASAAESATELGHNHIDTENLLLGLLRANKRDRLTDQGEGVVISVLKLLGINLELLEQQVLQLAPKGNRLAILAQPQSDSASPSITGSVAPQNWVDFTSSEVSARFCALLFAWVEPRQLGRVVGSYTQFQLPDGKVLTPRLAFVAADRLKRVPRTYPQIAPDLTVEVKSAFDSLSHLQEKMQAAIALGVKVGLLIDPDEHHVTLYRSNDEITVLGDREILTVPELFPGWELPIASLWSPVF